MCLFSQLEGVLGDLFVFNRFFVGILRNPAKNLLKTNRAPKNPSSWLNKHMQIWRKLFGIAFFHALYNLAPECNMVELFERTIVELPDLETFGNCFSLRSWLILRLSNQCVLITMTIKCLVLIVLKRDQVWHSFGKFEEAFTFWSGKNRPYLNDLAIDPLL